MDEVQRRTILFAAFVAPAVAVAAAAGIALALRSDRRRAFAASVGVAAGYIAAHWGLLGRPTLRNPYDWVAALAVAAAAIEIGGRLPLKALWGIRLAAVAAFTWLILPAAHLRSAHGAAGPFLWAVGLTAAIFASWVSLSRLARPRDDSGTVPIWIPIGLIAVGSATAGLMLESQYARAAQMAGGVTGAFGGVWAASWLARFRDLGSGAASTFAICWLGLVAHGYMGSWEPNPAAFLLHAAAPQLLWIGRIPAAVARLGPRLGAAVALAAAGLCAFGSVGLAIGMGGK